MIENIINHYIIIINDYFDHMSQSDVLTTIPNNTYIFSIGLNTLLHIYKIALLNTKNFEHTQFLCQKAYYCYLEYIEQMNKSELLHNLNNLDAIIFVYKKTLIDMNQLSVTIGYTNINNIPTSNTRNRITGNINNSNDELNYVLNSISVITKTLLFYKHQLVHENKECPEIYSESSYKNANISINDMKRIMNAFLHKYLQFLYPFETPIYNYSMLFEYIQFIQQKLNMSTDIYYEFLRELYKYIKKMKKTRELPNVSTLRHITITLFYNEDDMIKINNMITTNKMPQIIKMLFTDI